MTLLEGDEADDLELGRPPRAPLPRRRRRLAAVGVTVAVAAVGGVVLLARPDHHDHAPAAATVVQGGFAAGPVLVQGAGGDQLTVPGGAMFGGAAMNIPLAPASDAVTAIRSTVPSFSDVQGGRVTDPEIHYGIYLQGSYRSGGDRITLTVYTARAPETPASSDVTVTRVAVDGVERVRTDGSVYTGTGWWVHGIADAPVTAGATDQRAVLQALLADPRLVA